MHYRLLKQKLIYMLQGGLNPFKAIKKSMIVKNMLSNTLALCPICLYHYNYHCSAAFALQLIPPRPPSGLRLRSLEKTNLRVRRMKTHFDDRAFSDAGPRCQNSLSSVIRLADSMDSFKAQLRTHLFAKAYPMQLLVRLPCSGMAALLRHIICHSCYQTIYY